MKIHGMFLLAGLSSSRGAFRSPRVGLRTKSVTFESGAAFPVGGVALEEREYRAIGVRGDDEVGQPSAIVTGVWGA